MLIWITIAAIAVSLLTAAYTSIAQGEGSTITIPLILVCFGTTVYVITENASPLTIAAIMIVSLCTVSTLVNATWGMPRPGGGR